MYHSGVPRGGGGGGGVCSPFFGNFCWRIFFVKNPLLVIAFFGVCAKWKYISDDGCRGSELPTYRRQGTRRCRVDRRLRAYGWLGGRSSRNRREHQQSAWRDGGPALQGSAVSTRFFGAPVFWFLREHLLETSPYVLTVNVSI